MSAKKRSLLDPATRLLLVVTAAIAAAAALSLLPTAAAAAAGGGTKTTQRQKQTVRGRPTRRSSCQGKSRATEATLVVGVAIRCGDIGSVSQRSRIDWRQERLVNY